MVSLAQVLIFSAEFGSFVAIAAISFSIVYRVVGMINFAHGEWLTMGAYIGVLTVQALGGNALLALPVVVLLSGVGGYGLARGFYRPLRRSGAGPIMLMLGSIAVGYILRAGFRIVFSSEPKTVVIPTDVYRFDVLGGFFVNTTQLFVIGMAVIVFTVVHLMFKRTNVGIAMRATGSDEDLAEVCGIDTSHIRRNTWLSMSGLAGLAGFLIGVSTNVYPLLGYQYLLLLIAAAILGGIGSAYGAIAGAYVIGLAVTFTTSYLPTAVSTLGTAVAFVLLILVLLVRPSGIADVEAAT
ncbi:branched-chain amino acid ABC transporter permease [Haloplanus halophilus]|uniref:branched-chain amino acid ABC transporter permease n=1 Tax=Haloplanus halophilus TaxID=2949993 RepID=UPI0020404AC4|nr:branched-chain amino acid ABC transporter permease [Haloplanus sp. GDY1]